MNLSEKRPTYYELWLTAEPWYRHEGTAQERHFADPVKRYGKRWRRIRELSCRLFGHPAFSRATWQRLNDWLLERPKLKWNDILGQSLDTIIDWLRQAEQAGGDDEQPKDGERDAGDGWTWQRVVDELEALRLKGERYTSQEKLGKKIGCGKWLVGKAMREGPVELEQWRLESTQRGASRLNASPEAAVVAFDSTPQGREPDPADITDPADAERTMQRLIEEMGKRHGEEAQAKLQAQFATDGYDLARLQRLADAYLPDPDAERYRKADSQRAE